MPADTPAFRDWPEAFRFSRAAPRFAYCSYLPEAPRALLVAVHGSERSAMAYRDAFRPWAAANRVAILAPLFPCDPFGDGNGDGYKVLAERDLRYDLIALDMVAEMEERCGRRFPQFLLFGFSGGGHFVHRFFFLHPERLAAVAIGAPGGVTVLDPDQDSWAGIRDIEARFGRKVDVEALRRVPVQLLIGEKDVEVFAARATPGAPGRNRQERMDLLEASLNANGISTRRHTEPGVAHHGLAMIPAATAFFEPLLARD